MRLDNSDRSWAHRSANPRERAHERRKVRGTAVGGSEAEVLATKPCHWGGRRKKRADLQAVLWTQ